MADLADTFAPSGDEFDYSAPPPESGPFAPGQSAADRFFNSDGLALPQTTERPEEWVSEFGSGEAAWASADLDAVDEGEEWPPPTEADTGEPTYDPDAPVTHGDLAALAEQQAVDAELAAAIEQVPEEFREAAVNQAIQNLQAEQQSQAMEQWQRQREADLEQAEQRQMQLLAEAGVPVPEPEPHEWAGDRANEIYTELLQAGQEGGEELARFAIQRAGEEYRQHVQISDIQENYASRLEAAKKDPKQSVAKVMLEGLAAMGQIPLVAQAEAAQARVERGRALEVERQEHHNWLARQRAKDPVGVELRGRTLTGAQRARAYSHSGLSPGSSSWWKYVQTGEQTEEELW